MKKIIRLIFTLMVSILFMNIVSADRISEYSQFNPDTESISFVKTDDGMAHLLMIENIAVIRRYDNNGKLVTEKSLALTESFYVENVSKTFIDKDNNIILFGSNELEDRRVGTIQKFSLDSGSVFTNSLDFGSESQVTFQRGVETSDGGYAFFGPLYTNDREEGDPNNIIVKYDNNGNKLWEKKIYLDIGAYDYSDFIKSNEGGVYLFANVSNDTSYDHLMIKIDKDGNLTQKNIQDFGEVKNEYFHHYEDKDGNILTLRRYYIPDTYEKYFYVVKMNKNGEIITNSTFQIDFGEIVEDQILSFVKMNEEVYYMALYTDYDYYMLIKLNVKTKEIEVIEDDLETAYDGDFTTNLVFMNGSQIFAQTGYADLYVYNIVNDLTLDTSVPMSHGNVRIDGIVNGINTMIAPIIEPELGYELDKLIVNGVEVNGDKFYSTSDASIRATFKPIQYRFISGIDSAYNDEDMEFRLNGEFSLFDKLYINDKLVDSENYTVESGSTIITLKDSYLKTLKDGKYRLKVTYLTGVEDTTNFTVGEVISNPQTGDKLLTYIVGALIALFAMGASILIIEKRN